MEKQVVIKIANEIVAEMSVEGAIAALKSGSLRDAALIDEYMSEFSRTHPELAKDRDKLYKEFWAYMDQIKKKPEVKEKFLKEFERKNAPVGKPAPAFVRR